MRATAKKLFAHRPDFGDTPLIRKSMSADYAAVRAANKHIVGFRLEKECMQFVAELRERWVPVPPRGVRKWDAAKADEALQAVAAGLCEERWNYVRLGLDVRVIRFGPDGSILQGAAGCERWWNLRPAREGQAVELQVYGEQGLTFRAHINGDGAWHGRWEVFEKAEVVLAPWSAAACCRFPEASLLAVGRTDAL